jgi:Flp pilus assembly protein TadB
MLDRLSHALGIELTGWPGFVLLAAVVGIVAFGVARALGLFSPPPPSPKPQGDDIEQDVERLAQKLQTRQTGRDELQIEPELRRAGYYDKRALGRFQLIRALLVAVPLCVTAFLAVLAEPSQVVRVVMYGAVVTALGFSLPRVYIVVMGRARRRQIERGLPVALDLTSLALFGGQNVQSAFQRAAEAIRPTFPVLAEEMQLVLKQAELKTFPMALEQWSDRSGVPEVQNVSVAISQADRLGVNVADALMELSTNFRTGMRQRADATANRSSVWMLFPTIVCLWIPAGLILAAPVFFEFQDRRAKTREIIRQRSDTGDTLPDSFGKYLRRDSNMDMLKAKGPLPQPAPPANAAGNQPGL